MLAADRTRARVVGDHRFLLTREQTSQVEVRFVVEDPAKRGEREDGEDLVVGVVEVQRQLTRRLSRLTHGDQNQRIAIYKHVFVFT